MKTKFRISILAVKLLLGAVLFGGLMCVINSYVGYKEFMKELEIVYGNVTEQIARTGASYINADKIPYWLENGQDEEWEITNEKLDNLTNTADLAYIYVTTITPDFKARTYVFDTVNKLSLEAGSTIIPFGKVSSLENKEKSYVENLREIMEDGVRQSWFVYKQEEGGHVTTAIPLVDSNGKINSMIGIVKPMYEIKEYKQTFLKSIVITAVVFTIIFTVLYGIFLILRVVRPIVLVTNETSHFAEHHGELTGLLKKIKNRDEIGTLSKAVEKMSIDMNRYISDLTHATAEKERLGAELNVATQIQADMLPRVFPPFENHDEIELFALMEPAKEVGGDFYDFYMIDDKHFAVVVGDVSGKGVPAALFMVITKTLIKDTALHSLSPADIFNDVNMLLCEGNEAGLFVTCWLGILDITTGVLTFANAGHASPVISLNNKIEYLTSKPDLMLAGMPGTKYKNNTVQLEKNDRIFIYTDGVTEATNFSNELYGENRLLEVMKNINGSTPEQVVKRVKNDIQAFVEDAPQFDDITMLEMIFKG